MGVLDCVKYGIVLLYHRKFRIELLAPDVDSIPSDVCCAQCCGDTRTIGRPGL